MSYDPSGRTIAEMERDLVAFAVDSEKVGLEWADASSLYDQLDDLKKVILSESMPKQSKVDPKMSQAEKEQIALCSPAYRQHLDGLAEARRKANIAKVKYVAAQAKLDAIRTLLSNKRAMFQRGVEAA